MEFDVPDLFACVVVTPQEQVLDEQVKYASVPAHDGLLGVAPQRAAMVIKLGDGLLRLELPGGEARLFFIGGGFAQMRDNRLTLLTDTATPIDQIDAEAAQQDFDAAQQGQAVGDAQVERKQRALDSARMRLRLSRERST